MYELKTAESRKRTLCRGVNDDLFDDTCSTTDVSRLDHNTAFIEPDSRNNNIDNRTFIWDPCMSVISSAKSLPRPPTFENLQTCSSDKDTSDDNRTLCPGLARSETDSTCLSQKKIPPAKTSTSVPTTHQSQNRLNFVQKYVVVHMM